MLRHVRRTAAILSACGIGLGDVEIVAAKAPGGVHDLDMAPGEGLPAPRAVLSLASRVPEGAAWPRVFFLGRLRGDEALARSYRRGAVSPQEALRYPYMNTAWVAFKTHWMERKDEGYSTLAHEVAHLLCECGHEKGPNPHLLHEYRNFLSGEILTKHCGLMRASPLVRPSPQRPVQGLGSSQRFLYHP